MEKNSSKKTATKKTTTKKAVAKKPATKKPATKKPATKKEVTKKPTAKKTATKKIATKKAVAKKPTAKKTAVKKTAVKKPTTKAKPIKKTQKDSKKILAEQHDVKNKPVNSATPTPQPKKKSSTKIVVSVCIVVAVIVVGIVAYATNKTDSPKTVKTNQTETYDSSEYLKKANAYYSLFEKNFNDNLIEMASCNEEALSDIPYVEEGEVFDDGCDHYEWSNSIYHYQNHVYSQQFGQAEKNNKKLNSRIKKASKEYDAFITETKSDKSSQISSIKKIHKALLKLHELYKDYYEFTNTTDLSDLGYEEYKSSDNDFVSKIKASLTEIKNALDSVK